MIMHNLWRLPDGPLNKSLFFLSWTRGSCNRESFSSCVCIFLLFNVCQGYFKERKKKIEREKKARQLPYFHLKTRDALRAVVYTRRPFSLLVGTEPLDEENNNNSNRIVDLLKEIGTWKKKKSISTQCWMDGDPFRTFSKNKTVRAKPLRRVPFA